MSQYAYVPIERINDIQLSYTIGPDSWTFETDGTQYGGIEEIVFTQEQKSEITSLGGQWFDDAGSFQLWLSVASDPMSQVIRDRQFGELMINKYLTKNKELELSVSQSIAQLTKFGNIKMLLEVGAIRPALTLIETTTIDEVYTQDRKDSDINEISEYLNK